jgi:cyclase
MSRMPDPELVEVAVGVFAYVQPDGGWMINNTGIVTGGGEHLLIDTTSTESRNRALLAAVETVARGTRRALVNTHHHGDHTFGNWLMPAQVPVIGHTWCREDLLAAGLVATQVLRGPDYGHLEVRAPEVTFESALTLHVGDRTVELHHLGPAHTRGDVVAWLPEERVLFAGDIAFAGGQPFLVEGSIAGYLRALARLRTFQPAVLVPGHGPVRHGQEISRLLDDLDLYARFVTARRRRSGGRPDPAADRARGRRQPLRGLGRERATGRESPPCLPRAGRRTARRPAGPAADLGADGNAARRPHPLPGLTGSRCAGSCTSNQVTRSDPLDRRSDRPHRRFAQADTAALIGRLPHIWARCHCPLRPTAVPSNTGGGPAETGLARAGRLLDFSPFGALRLMQTKTGKAVYLTDSRRYPYANGSAPTLREAQDHLGEERLCSNSMFSGRCG